ncbi:hypothetical protein J437_LFUL004333 [Ladona fulva]|uniref:Uncharacterized protein n=1 Tax=Ladona fulva TaxID=123851 RepID=A0A8K0K972_LADFU|nr:hypothetical protein J437_LFUL004333 [Ladona fulva]
MVQNHQTSPSSNVNNAGQSTAQNFAAQNYTMMLTGEIEEHCNGESECYNEIASCPISRAGSHFTHRSSNAYVQHHQLMNAQQMSKSLFEAATFEESYFNIRRARYGFSSPVSKEANDLVSKLLVKWQPSHLSLGMVLVHP